MKYFLILIITLLIVSCADPSYDNTVSKLTVIKSDTLLSQPIDTITIVRVDKIIYEVNDNIITTQYGLRNHNSLPIYLTFDELVIIIILILVVGVVIGALLPD